MAAQISSLAVVLMPRRRAFCLGVLLAGSLLVAEAHASSVGLLSVPVGEFANKVRMDGRRLERYVLGARAAVDLALSRPDAFGPAQKGGRAPGDAVFALDVWARLLDHMLAADGVQGFYGSFASLDPSQPAPHRVEAFLLAYTAHLSLLSVGFALRALVASDPGLRQLLDGGDHRRGLPGGLLAAYGTRLDEEQRLDQLVAGYEYFRRQRPKLRQWRVDRNPGLSWMLPYIERRYRELLPILDPVGRISIAEADDALVPGFFAPWFPLAAELSPWLGAQGGDWSLVGRLKEPQQQRLASMLRPGDVILSRRSWDPLELGMPGYWTHSALYVGTPSEWTGFFAEDEETSHFFRRRGVPKGRLSFYLLRRFPDAWLRFHRAAAEGQVQRVAQADHAGVVLAPMEAVLRSDSVAVLRPRVSRVRVAAAIARAFHHLGRPYDFSHDAEDEGALSGLELVERVYLPGDGLEGLAFPRQEILGRQSLPTSSLVRWFAESSGPEDGAWRFVAFFDGEGGQRARESDARGLRQTLERPRWRLAPLGSSARP